MYPWWGASSIIWGMKFSVIISYKLCWRHLALVWWWKIRKQRDKKIQKEMCFVLICAHIKKRERAEGTFQCWRQELIVISTDAIYVLMPAGTNRGGKLVVFWVLFNCAQLFFIVVQRCPKLSKKTPLNVSDIKNSNSNFFNELTFLSSGYFCSCCL